MTTYPIYFSSPVIEGDMSNPSPRDTTSTCLPSSPSSTSQNSETPIDSNNLIASQYILYKYLTSGPATNVYNKYPCRLPASSSSNFQFPNKKNAHGISIREIPTWNIYYGDQRQRDSLVEFSFPENPIRPDNTLNKCVSLCFDDVCITKLAVDAIVNSTTKDYSEKFGVSQRIHEEAGKSLQDACRSLRILNVGEAEITHGFNLPAKFCVTDCTLYMYKLQSVTQTTFLKDIIHTNGPIGIESDSDQESNTKLILLKNCYEQALNLLLLYNLRTIAFPCISTGLKNMNHEASARIVLKTVRRFLESNRSSVDRIIFCLHNAKDILIYRRFMQIYFPVEQR